MREAGVPEPPGRVEALAPPGRVYVATMRHKKTGATVAERVSASSYHVALAQVRQRFKDCTLITLIDGKDFDRRYGDDRA